MTSRQKTLTKTEISTFEKIQKLEFVSYYSLIIECEREKKMKKKMKSTEQKLRLTKKKLKITESNDLKKKSKKLFELNCF